MLSVSVVSDLAVLVSGFLPAPLFLPASPNRSAHLHGLSFTECGAAPSSAKSIPLNLDYPRYPKHHRRWNLFLEEILHTVEFFPSIPLFIWLGLGRQGCSFRPARFRKRDHEHCTTRVRGSIRTRGAPVSTFVPLRTLVTTRQLLSR